MNRDIFCKNCKYYRNDPNFRYPIGKNTGMDIHTTCECQYNIDTHYGRKDPRKYISSPSIINRCHDCTWYEKLKKLETYLWDSDLSFPKKYKDHGQGTFNINPEGGIDGFYIGNKTLKEIILETSTKDVDEIKEEVAEHETKINNLIVNVENHSTEINNINNSINVLNNKVNTLEDKTEDQEEKINQIEEKVSDIEDEIDVQDTKIDTIETKVNVQNTKIENITAKVEEDDNRITALENRVDGHDTELENLKEKVENNTEKIEQHDNKINQLNTLVINGNIRMNEMEDRLDVIDERVDVFWEGRFSLDCGNSASNE